MDHQISKLISVLIATTGQFCCVSKIRQLAFLLYLVSENTQSSFHIPPYTSFRKMHLKDKERIPTAEAANIKMAQYSTTLTADTPHIKWTRSVCSSCILSHTRKSAGCWAGVLIFPVVTDTVSAILFVST